MEPTERPRGSVTTSKNFQEGRTSQNSKPLPTPKTDSSSQSSIGKFFRRKSSSDVTPSRDSEDSKTKKLLGILKKSPRPEEEHSISSPMSHKPLFQTRNSRGIDSKIEFNDDDSLIGNCPTITPRGIRRLFKPPVDNKAVDELVTFDFALKYLFEMGQELSRAFLDPKRGLNELETKINQFMNIIIPQLETLNIQQQKVDISHPPKDQTIDETVIEDENPLYCMFTARPGNFDNQKDVLDRALHPIYEICSELVKISKDPRIGMDELKKKFVKFQTDILPRFRNKIFQEQASSKITTYSEGIEKKFSDEIDHFLKKELFIDLTTPFDFPENRNVFMKLLPDEGEIFKELESRQSNALADSKEKKNKLEKDYDFLVSSFKVYERICEKYCLALEKICLELNKRSLLEGEPSSIGIINDIIKKLDHHCASSVWKTMSAEPIEVKKKWLNIIHRKIKFEYLDAYKPVMMENYRISLLENISARPCTVPSFRQLLLEFEKKLFLTNMSAPIDVARIFKLEGFVNCFTHHIVENPEVETPVGRFKNLLKTFSVLFGEEFSDMFWDLAVLLEFPSDVNLKSSAFETDYPKAYENFKNLTDEKREEIKAQILEKYPSVEFEKVLKYFKLSQDFLNQSIIYFFTVSLMSARASKFKTKMDMCSEKDIQKKEKISDSGFKKTQIDVEASPSKSRCKIKVSRSDGLIDPRVQLKQVYTFAFNVYEDTFNVPYNVAMSLTCPSDLAEKDEKVKSLLFDLPLIAESLGFPPLKIDLT